MGGNVGLDRPQPEREGPTRVRAGGRARDEYERRRAKDRARIRSRWPWIVVLMVLAFPIGYGMTRVGLDVLMEAFGAKKVASGDAHKVGMWVGLGLVAFVGTELLGRKRSTHAFRIGAEGEERVGAILDSMRRHGYMAVHDVPLGGWGNIDHILVGPGGVYTVETKNTAGVVTIRRGRIRQAGRSGDNYVSQARRQAETVVTLLNGYPDLRGIPVTPILCYARAEIKIGLFASNVIDGVRVVGPRGLSRVRKSRPALTAEQVGRAAQVLSSR